MRQSSLMLMSEYVTSHIPHIYMNRTPSMISSVLTERLESYLIDMMGISCEHHVFALSKSVHRRTHRLCCRNLLRLSHDTLRLPFTSSHRYISWFVPRDLAAIGPDDATQHRPRASPLAGSA
jgi:hypothetical protein